MKQSEESCPKAKINLVSFQGLKMKTYNFFRLRTVLVLPPKEFDRYPFDQKPGIDYLPQGNKKNP